jgi:beta-glucosidase
MFKLNYVKNHCSFIKALRALVLSFGLVYSQANITAQTKTNNNQTIEQKVEALISKMTLEEKIAQVCSVPVRLATAIEEGFANSQQPTFARIRNGIGSLENPFDGKNAVTSAKVINQMQRFLLDSTRLKIPAIVGSECLHGHAGLGSTIFPQAIAMSCSWNPTLVNKVFDITGREARLRGSTEAHTPVLDLGRDPRWGRIEETYGEDSYLTSQMAYAAVTGLQGGNSGVPGLTHIISSPKHFAGYAQVAGGRNFAPTSMSTRTLYDDILPPFKVAVTKANALGMMASHCDIDGVPAHGNHWLLTELLRNQWDFKGIVVSDYNDIERLHIFHKVAANVGDAAKMALKAGMDLDLPNMNAYGKLKEVIQTDPSLVKDLDTSVRRILSAKFKLGLFDNPFVDGAACEKYVGSKENIALALKIAEESIVLLKNENGLLPLNKNNIKSIAVLGPNARSLDTGVYSIPNKRIVSIFEGITKELGDKIEVSYTEGCKIPEVTPNGNPKTVTKMFSLEEEEKSIQEAVELAKKSDVAIICVGGNINTSREAVFAQEHKGDSSTIDLFGNQEELIKRVYETGKPVIIILMGGKPYAIPEVEKQAKAILATFYCGEQAGTAISNILFGKVNPSGKTSISFPRSVGQLPVYYSQKATAFYKDYIDETSRPLFAFGHGLSYTTFEIRDLKIEKQTIAKNEKLQFKVTVKNTGTVAGAEVVQVYFSDKIASVTRSEKLLVRFDKVFLEPGQKKTISFEIQPEEDLAFTGLDYQRIVEPGKFELLIGKSSDNIVLKQEFEVK